MEFGKRYDTTDTADFWPRQIIVTDLSFMLQTCYGLATGTGVLDFGLNGLTIRRPILTEEPKNTNHKQESLAIAKTTARCAQYMGALKSFESPRKRPRLLFQKFVKGFVPIDTKNAHTKFEVRSFIRS